LSQCRRENISRNASAVHVDLCIYNTLFYLGVHKFLFGKSRFYKQYVITMPNSAMNILFSRTFLQA
jgi:hypothetical protein